MKEIIETIKAYEPYTEEEAADKKAVYGKTAISRAVVDAGKSRLSFFLFSLGS